MKKSVLTFAFVIASCGITRAQWQTIQYSLKGGWNAIHLEGNASYDTLDNMLPAGVVEVWRWNASISEGKFSQSPLIPSAGTPEWSVWKRGLPAESTLSQLTGQASYLVKCTGASTATVTVNLRQAILPPSNQWTRSGANLMGFPALQNGTNSPLFSNYFAAFPVASAPNTRIFKYTGGDLGPANPAQVFSPSVERLDRTKAYWFSAEVVGNFYAPVEVSLSTLSGLVFGRTGSEVIAQVRNRTASPVTLTFSPVNSEAAPAGQPAITAAVPLTRRIYNTTTLDWDATPVTAAFTEVVGPQSTLELRFGIDRTAAVMTGAPADALFASFLRMTDSGDLVDIYLPSSATKATLAGLWVGDISLKQAGFTSTGAGDTPREFPLRTLLHVDDAGTARLLSKVFIGRLAAGANDVGLCTDESLLKTDAKATAQRLVAAHLPLDQVISAGSGSVGTGASLVRTVQIPFNDPTNPFVHQYHPDHDNKDARGNPLPAGVESPNITRTCTFTFTAAPPPGTGNVSGWGSTVIGGTYAETVSGLHRNDLSLTGTFLLRRASELGAISTP